MKLLNGVELLGYIKERHVGQVSALRAGGAARSPLKKEILGDTFGSLNDKYVVEWMMNIDSKQE